MIPSCVKKKKSVCIYWKLNMIVYNQKKQQLYYHWVKELWMHFFPFYLSTRNIDPFFTKTN